MTGLYLRKKSFRSSLFFLTPLFLPQWGKLNTTRSNTRPWRETQPPSLLQSTSNSTDPPEQNKSKNCFPLRHYRAANMLNTSEILTRFVDDVDIVGRTLVPQCLILTLQTSGRYAGRRCWQVLAQRGWKREVPLSNQQNGPWRRHVQYEWTAGNRKTHFSEGLSRNLPPFTPWSAKRGGARGSNSDHHQSSSWSDIASEITFIISDVKSLFV